MLLILGKYPSKTELNILFKLIKKENFAFHCGSVNVKLLFADDWNKESHPYQQLPYGKWELKIPAKDGACPIPHLSETKV